MEAVQGPHPPGRAPNPLLPPLPSPRVRVAAAKDVRLFLSPCLCSHPIDGSFSRVAFVNLAYRSHSEQRVRALLGARSIQRGIPHCICARFVFYRFFFGFCFTLSFRAPGAGSTWSPLNTTRNPSAVCNPHHAGVSHLCIMQSGGGPFLRSSQKWVPGVIFTRDSFLALPYRSHFERRVRALLGARAIKRYGLYLEPAQYKEQSLTGFARSSFFTVSFRPLLYVVIPNDGCGLYLEPAQ